MAFTTDVVAVDLRNYPHSPALLADLAREGYELFNPEGQVFFRRHNRLTSQPVPLPDAVPQPTPGAETAPEIDYDRLAERMAAALTKIPRPRPGTDQPATPPDAATS